MDGGQTGSIGASKTTKAMTMSTRTSLDIILDAWQAHERARGTTAVYPACSALIECLREHLPEALGDAAKWRRTQRLLKELRDILGDDIYPTVRRRHSELTEATLAAQKPRRKR